MRLALPGIALALLTVTAGPAAAAPFTFNHPTAGELMEGGCPYYIEWTGGTASNVNLSLIDTNTNMVAAVHNNTPNDGVELWTLPDNLPNGTYQLYIEDVGLTTWTYGPSITYEAPPACDPSCTRLSVLGTTNGVCYADSASADSAATADVGNQLQDQCPPGYQLNYGTLRIDYRHWDPYRTCDPYYLAHAPATICCCPLPVPTTPTSWGLLKSRYGAD